MARGWIRKWGVGFTIALVVVAAGSAGAAVAVARSLQSPPQHRASAHRADRTQINRETSRARKSLTAAGYSLAVTRICARSLLFDHTHELGTRADALEVARDIRASTTRRLVDVSAVPAPAKLRRSSRRWIALQRRLAESYARDWVSIYDTIDAANTPAQRARLAQRLERLVHEPDPLRLAAGRLEVELHVPDCTGGR